MFLGFPGYLLLFFCMFPVLVWQCIALSCYLDCVHLSLLPHLFPQDLLYFCIKFVSLIKLLLLYPSCFWVLSLGPAYYIAWRDILGQSELKHLEQHEGGGLLHSCDSSSKLYSSTPEDQNTRSSKNCFHVFAQRKNHGWYYQWLWEWNSMWTLYPHVSSPVVLVRTWVWLLCSHCTNKPHQGGKQIRVQFKPTKHCRCENTLNPLLHELWQPQAGMLSIFIHL